MSKQFELLSEAFQLLNWKERSKSLEILRNNYEQKLYFVAFVGQYSAGKSHLINNLLGKAILPTGLRETTPLLTYIRYGSFEYARLHYQDLTTREISLEDARTITQTSQKWDIDCIDHMEIFVNTEILRSGLIFLDTPGINTMIERHQELLSTSLDLASRVVFVVGQAPHKNDVETMKMLSEYGMKLAYVRTHFDEINPCEEDPNNVIRQDKALVESCGIPEDCCFHVSNLVQSQWFDNMRLILSMLEQDGQNTKQALEQATIQQLRKMQLDCISALEEKQTILEAVKAGNDERCTQKLAEYEDKINQLDSTIEKRARQLRNELHANKRTIHGKIRQESDGFLEDAVHAISHSDDTVQTSTQMSALMNEQTRLLFRKILNHINSVIDPLLQIDELEGFSLDTEMLPATISYTDLVQAQNSEDTHLMTQLQYLRDHRSELEQQLQHLYDDPAYRDLQAILIALEQEIEEAKHAYESIPPYSPQMIQVEDNRMQPSQIAKTIGSIADWALMLIPGEAVVGAIKHLGSSSKVVAKIAKVIGSTEKIEKIVKEGDKLKDILFALKNMSKTYATKSRKEKAMQVIDTTAERAGKVLDSAKKLSESDLPPSFLDLLTIEHWAERIGKKFDHPPKFVVDKEYEQQYRETKAAIEKELRDRQQRAYNIKCQQQVFSNEQERLSEERKAAIVDERTVLTELEKRKAIIELNAKKAAMRQWKKDCGEWFRGQISPQINKVLSQYLEDLASRLQRHHEDSVQPLRNQLLEAKKMYQNMLSDRDTIPDELQQVTSLIKRFKELPL